MVADLHTEQLPCRRNSRSRQELVGSLFATDPHGERTNDFIVRGDSELRHTVRNTGTDAELGSCGGRDRKSSDHGAVELLMDCVIECFVDQFSRHCERKRKREHPDYGSGQLSSATT